MPNLYYRTLKENVVDIIRDKILTREYKPGMRLIEQELAEELAVSRGPVREALRELARERIVEYSRNVGCFVRGVSLEDVYEIYMLRAYYEMISIRLCEGQIPESGLKAMEKALDCMKKNKLGEFRKVAEYDVMFHEAIINAGDMPRLKKAWEDLNYGAIISSYISYADRNEMIMKQQEIHQSLFDTCCEKDADQICEEIAHHYGLVMERNVKKNGELSSKYKFTMEVHI